MFDTLTLLGILSLSLTFGAWIVARIYTGDFND